MRMLDIKMTPVEYWNFSVKHMSSLKVIFTAQRLLVREAQYLLSARLLFHGHSIKLSSSPDSYMFTPYSYMFTLSYGGIAVKSDPAKT